MNVVNIIMNSAASIVGKGAGAAASTGVSNLMSGGDLSVSTATGQLSPQDMSTLMGGLSGDLHNQTLGTPVQANILPATSGLADGASSAMGAAMQSKFMVPGGLGLAQPLTISPSLTSGGQIHDLMKEINDLKAQDGDGSKDGAIKVLEQELGQEMMQQSGTGAGVPGLGGPGQAPATDPMSAYQSKLDDAGNQATLAKAFMDNGNKALDQAQKDFDKGDMAALDDDLKHAYDNFDGAKQASDKGLKEMGDVFDKMFEPVLEKRGEALQSMMSGGPKSALSGGDDDSDLTSALGINKTPVEPYHGSSVFDRGELSAKLDSDHIVSNLEGALEANGIQF